jgi:hypothetical protein
MGISQYQTVLTFIGLGMYILSPISDFPLNFQLISYSVLHLFIILCVAADKHVCHYCGLYSKGVISMFILQWATG